MLSAKSLKLMGAYYKLAFKLHCTPFEWNWKSQKMSKTKNKWSFGLWVFWACLMWTKIIFMTVQLYQSYVYLEVTVDQFCVHYYYWVLYVYCGFLQWNELDMRDWFPLMVNRFTTFNSNSKRKYFPHIITVGLLPKDDIGKGVINCFGIVMGNSLVTFYLFLDDPHSPQFFYSVLSPIFSDRNGQDSSYWILCFAILEAYLTAFSWTSILLWTLTSICCSATLHFWLQQINMSYNHIHLSRPNSKIREFNEKMKIYRNLQVLITEYNSVALRMTVAVKAAVFWSHLGTNYGSIRLFNSMKFQIWINCPLVSIFGLAIILQLFKLLAWVNVEAVDCLASMKRELCAACGVSTYNNRSFTKRFFSSMRPLGVKGHHFYYYQRTTPVTFYKTLTDYTINVLLTF